MALSPCADDVEAKGNDVCDEAQWGQAGRPEEVHLPVLPDPSPRKTCTSRILCGSSALQLLRLSLYVCTSSQDLCTLCWPAETPARARHGSRTGDCGRTECLPRPKTSYQPHSGFAPCGVWICGAWKTRGPGNRHVPLRAPRRARPRHAGVKPRKLLVAMILLALCGSLL